jgi:hypothetical protein
MRYDSGPPDSPPEALDPDMGDNDPDVVDYRRRYCGVTRGELQRRAPRLYWHLYRKKLLHVVLRRYRRFTEPLLYYKKHYAGVTRTALFTADPSLYHRLSRDGLLDRVPCHVARKPDPFREYLARYPGMTRGQVQILDPRLYMRLRRAGCLHLVPTKRNPLSPENYRHG